MSDFDATIGKAIAQLNAIPHALDALVPKLAAVVKAYLQECYARGVDPYGVPWEPTKLGRKPAITGSTITAVTRGSKIIVQLSWHDALHSKGQARGGVRRPMLPMGKLPPALVERMRRVVHDELQQVTAGAA